MRYLSLTIPGYGKITPPPNIPSGVDAPGNIIQTFIALFLVAGVVAALIFTLYGGILWATSQGDKQKLDHARRTIIFAIIGLIIMLFAFIIIQLVGTLLGSEFLKNIGK